MFTYLKSAPTARRAATVCAEKPHCGKSGVPFMNSTTGLASSVLILSTTSIRYLPRNRFAALGKLPDELPLLARAHRHPAPNLRTAAPAADAQSMLIQAAHVD